MSTHRRAWQQRAGVVVALVTGTLLAVPAAPALAAEARVSPGSVSLNAGSDTTVRLTVIPGPEDTTARLGLTGLPAGVSCVNGCGDVQLSGSPKTVLLTIKANDNAADANGTVTAQVQPDKSDPATADFSLAVKAKAAPQTTQPQQPPPPPQEPQQVQTVKSVSGKVTIAANGDPVPNAVVMLIDSQQHKFSTTSDDSGNFRITGTSQNPIVPGRLELGASKDAIVATKSFDASAGQSITGQRLPLAIKVEVSPSATPSATAEAAPTQATTDEDETTETDAPAAAAPAAAEDDGGGFGSFLIILLGGLLVAAGVGTIVLLMMRRRNADEDDVDGPVGAAAGAVPAARGAFRGGDDQTRVVDRVGAGPDPTMVGGAALGDAPTMLQRPVVDDVPPDPYGAAPQSYGAGGAAGGWAGAGYGDEPAPGGYGQQGGYGNAPASGAGYGNAPASGGGYGAAPASGGGYGAAGAAGAYGAAGAAGGYGAASSGYDQAGGYGADQGGYPAQEQGGGYGERYDEPTGRYTGDGGQSYAPPADPYPTSTYQPEQVDAYGQADQGGYGRGPEPTGGYGYAGQAGGYEAQDGGYDQQRGGYDQSGGYGSGQHGYDQSGGYGQQGGYDQGGYGQEPPQQRTGSYDNHAYDQRQGGQYGDQAGAGRARSDAAGQDRGGRRLDWLDD